MARMRSRGDNQFRERPAEPLGAVPEQRSREPPLSSRDRTQPQPTTPAPPDTSVPSWEQDRGAVLEAIVGLREMCEALHEQLTETRWRQLGTSFDNPNEAYHALNRWEREERARIEAAGGSRDDEGKEEPFEIPPLRTLRQT